MPHYSEIHLFIDESGPLQKQTICNEVLLVGGLVVLGPYGDQQNKELMSILRVAASASRLPFPAGLHTARPAAFHKAVARGLTVWGQGQSRAYSAILQHAADMQLDRSGLFAERDNDNRYIRMVLALLESLLFVDEAVAGQLEPDACVHLHVAKRVYVFPADPLKEAELRAQGYEVRADPKRSHLRRVAWSLTPREMTAFIRSACLHRWQHSKLRLATVDISPIDYDGGASIAGLYLADIVLTEAAYALRRGMCLHGHLAATPVFHRCYGPWLRHIADAKAAVLADDTVGFLNACSLLSEYGTRSDVEEALGWLHKLAANLSHSRTQMRRCLEQACDIVEQPGRAAAGRRLAEAITAILHPDAPVELHAMATQVRLSAANHTGDRTQADSLWAEYLSLERALRAAGSEGLRLVAEMRNRRAVSLMDQFRLDEAESVLRDLIRARGNALIAVARAFGITPDELPDRELGACYGSLGQIHALRAQSGDDEHAEACFRRAVALLSEPADIERQWVYMGHLACDRGPRGRALWDEVTSHIPRLRDMQDPIAKNGLQFQLALQAKGILVFGDAEAVRSFLSAWDRQSPVGAYPQAARCQHPFGLICQSLGLLHARVFKHSGTPESRQAALRWFDAATGQMSEGGPILKVLACVAQIRKLLLLADSPVDARRNLSRALAVMKGTIIDGIGDAAWLERDDGRADGIVGRLDPGPAVGITDRARQTLGAFRFNYW